MKKEIEVIRNIAPTLAVALEGPLAGLASKLIAEKLAIEQISASSSTDDILNVLLGSTENLSKIKDLEEPFKLEMKKLSIDIFSLKYSDVTKRINVDKTNIIPQTIISTLFLVAYFILLGAIFFVEISDTVNMKTGENSLMGEFQILFGVLTAGVGQIFGFWFSGSPGKVKTSTEKEKQGSS